MMDRVLSRHFVWGGSFEHYGPHGFTGGGCGREMCPLLHGAFFANGAQRPVKACR